ncbi:branched-chain amino acid ABC transporter permease [Kyrpidia sp.]|uniref:branched-chain amino acid ABC transporter permease n=1 Tax=Kyrpidia sp. TaxID=2073077 RepID=UPI00258D18C9|nr:branched-chain amino acid ABC transporter permease [Kyrpidia sp.]MCL6575054.1 branched-chain amino acid ABC transporter permease [Kyrpidia sp.]
MLGRMMVLLLLGGALVLPVAVPDEYLIHTLIMAGFNIMLVLSLFLISGFVGQISMGHAAFFGIGAYVSALVSLHHVPVWLGFLVASLVSLVVGLAIGYPVLRLKGHFFAIATLGFGEIVRLLINNWVDITGGPMGITNIQAPEGLFGLDLSSKQTYYYLVLLFVIGTIYLLVTLRDSKFGRGFIAIRLDEITAGAMGINTASYKILAFMLSCMVAGLSGALYAHYIRFLSPEMFTLNKSIDVLVMLLIGGVNSIWGCVVSALVITLMNESLQSLDIYQMFVFGILILLIVLFVPKGLGGLFQRYVAAGRGLKRGTHLAD